MVMPRLRRVETLTMRDSGFSVIGSAARPIFVYDQKAFARWMIEGMGHPGLVKWSVTCDPPVIYLNNFVWIYSPGPPAHVASYQDPA